MINSTKTPKATKDNHKYRLMRPLSKLADQLPEPYPGSVNAAIARYLHLVSSTDLPEFSEAEWSILLKVCEDWESCKEDPKKLRSILLAKVLRKNSTLSSKIASLSEMQLIALVHRIERLRSFDLTIAQ